MLYRDIIAVCSQIHTKHINNRVERIKVAHLQQEECSTQEIVPFVCLSCSVCPQRACHFCLSFAPSYSKVLPSLSGQNELRTSICSPINTHSRSPGRTGSQNPCHFVLCTESSLHKSINGKEEDYMYLIQTGR